MPRKAFTPPMYLDDISFQLSYRMEEEGYTAVPIPSSEPYEYWDSERRHGRGIVSLKHAGQLAGIGCIGKNTLLVNNRYGNRLWLGAVISDAVLEPDGPAENLCPESCRICIDACARCTGYDNRQSEKMPGDLRFFDRRRRLSVCMQYLQESMSFFKNIVGWRVRELKNSIRPWSFRKHVLFSLFISLIVYIAKLLLPLKEAASIGIIGGADGPTAIFVGGADGPTAVFVAAKTVKYLLFDFIGIILFVVLLALYLLNCSEHIIDIDFRPPGHNAPLLIFLPSALF